MMSLIDRSTIVPVANIESFVSGFGWHRGRQVDPVAEVRRLNRAGYDASQASWLLEEFAYLEFNVEKQNLFWRFSFNGEIESANQTGKIRVGGKISSRWYFSRGESVVVNRFFAQYFDVHVTRVGITDFDSPRGIIPGNSGIGLLFYDGLRLFELLVFDSPYLQVYSTFANFLALKCLPLEQLDSSKIVDAVCLFPPDELENDDNVYNAFESLRNWFERVCYW